MTELNATESSIQRKKRNSLILQLSPVFLVLLVLFGGSVVYAIMQSLGYAPIYGVNEFPTIRYYKLLWTSDSFWFSMGITFYYALASTLIGLVCSIILATLMLKHFKEKAWVKYVYKLPLMIPYIVGIALVIIVFGNGGIAARLTYALGFIESPSEFPAILYSHYGWGIIMVYVWKQIPFMTLAIYAVLLGIGRETEEAATLLGASKLKVFWHVTLPQILPGIVSSTLICFSFNFGSFEAPFILGGGFPDTLPVTAWRYFNDADYTLRLQGMATVITIAFLSGLVLYTYVAMYRRFERKIGRS